MKNRIAMMLAAVAAMFAAGAVYSATDVYYAGGEGTEAEHVNIASSVWTNSAGTAITPSSTTYNLRWPVYFSSEGPVYMTNTTAVGTFVCNDFLFHNGGDFRFYGPVKFNSIYTYGTSIEEPISITKYGDWICAYLIYFGQQANTYTVFTNKSGNISYTNKYDWRLGNAAYTISEMVIENGTVELTGAAHFIIADNNVCTGTVRVANNSILRTKNTGKNIYVGNLNTKSHGELWVSGNAQVSSAQHMHIGRAGYGLVDVSGNGLVSVANTVYFGENNAAGTGYINISDNGVFEAKIFQPSKGKGYISFDGGTLRAKASGMFFNGNAALFVTVGENGGTIDTQAFTVTNMMASCEGTGTLTKKGSGTLVFTKPSTHEGGYVAEEGTLAFSGTSVTTPVVAENGGTVRFEDGTTVSGTVNLRAGGALEIVDNTATGGDFVFTRNSILSIVTDTSFVPRLTIGSTPLYNPIKVKLSGKTPIVNNAPILSVTEGTLVNRASQLPAITFDKSGLSDAVALGAEFSVSLSADLKTLLLSTTITTPGNTFSWTGAGDGVKFSDGANWGGGAAPAPGAAINLYFPTPSGAISNDIAGLTPVSITFGRNCPDVTIAGEEFSGLAAITNLSTFGNAVFTAPVSYTDRVVVYHGALFANTGIPSTWYSNESGMVVFEGGVTGSKLWDNASTGPHNIYAGHFRRTSTAPYSSTRGGSVYRNVFYRDSSFWTRTCGNLYELALDCNAKFYTEYVTNTSSRVAMYVFAGAEFVVSNELVCTGTGNRHMCYGKYTTNPVFKIEKIVQRMTANWALLGNITDATTTYETYYIGSGGINLAGQSASQTGYVGIGDENSRAYKHITVRPWYSDFTIGRHPGGNAAIAVRGTTTFCTDDEQGEARTITMDGNMYHNVTHGFTISGKGTFRFNADNVTHGGNAFTSSANPVTVSGAATFEMGPGSRFSLGALTVNDGTVYSIVDASATTVTNGAMNVASGATVKIANLSAAIPAIYASGTVTAEEGSSLVLNGEPLSDGVYTVIESASAIPLATASAFTLSGTALEGRPAFLSYSADGKKLVLTVGASTAFVWTGAGADANFSTPGNWLGGVAPAAGATTPIVFQSGSGTVYNDVGVLKPETITFTGVADGFEVAGAYGFEDVASVANASATVNPKISVPVHFADTINVKQTVLYKVNTEGLNVDYDGKTYVEFAGGAYGTTNGPPQSGWSNVVKGHYYFTDAENYIAPTLTSDGKSSLTIGSGSSISADVLRGKIGEMEIDAGGAFTVGVYRAQDRLLRTNYGEFVITNELIAALPNNDIYSHWRWSGDGKFKIEKITVDDSACSKERWFRFSASDTTGGNDRSQRVYIGAGGINFAPGRQFALTSICFGGRNSGHHTYVYPWHSDYTIAKSDLESATRDIAFSTAPVHMMTEEENGTPHTITLNGIADDKATVYIEGAGAFIVNSDCTRSGATIVTNGATLAFGPGADFGTGAMTFHAGTTLKFTDGLSTGTTGGALTLPGGDGSVALVIDGETLTEGDYPVYVSSAVLPAGVAGTFRLSGTAIPDPAEKKSTLYVSADGKQLRLLVGNPVVETDDFVWTGAAGDGKFSTPGNWLGNKNIATATSASKIYISVPSDATLDCDVSVTAGSITFPSGSAKVTLSGSGSLTLNAITNSGANVHHSFAVPVTITGEAAINVTHSAASYVEFPGGLTGYALPAESGYYKGVLTLTSEAAWGSFNQDIYILGSAEEPTTRVHVKFTQNLSYLNISTNAVFETDVFSHTGDVKWFCRVNDGTLKVGAYTITAGNNYPGSSSSGNVQHYGVIEVDAITNNAGNASSCWFRFEPGSGNGRPWQKWVIGAGGINYGSGATRTDCGYDIAGQTTAFFYPKADYALGCSSKNITYGDYRVEANCKFVYSTTDYYTGEPRTVTMNGRIGDAGTIDICGAGTFVVTTNSIHTGGTVVSNTVTLVFANENAALGTGPLTMCGGTTLAVPLVAGETDPRAIAGTVQYDGEGAVALKIGDGSALDVGTYKVLAAGDAVSGELVSKLSLANSASSAAFYIADGGKTLMLSVGVAPVITEYVWSGAIDNKMSKPGNWLGGAVPGTGAEVFFASGAEGTIENDIEGFAPKSITFTEGIGEGLTLSGKDISVSGAITNRSTTVSPVIAAKTLFTSGNILVKHNGTGNIGYTGTTVRFAGGVTGETVDMTGNWVYDGYWTIANTLETPWTCGTDSATAANRAHVASGSCVAPNILGQSHSLDILPGGAVTANVVNITIASNGQRLWAWNAGEFVVTGSVDVAGIGNKLELATGWQYGSTSRLEKVTIDGATAAKHFCFGNDGNAATHLFYIGDGGLNFKKTSETLARYSIGFDQEGDIVTLKPWHGSFNIGQAGDKGLFRFRSNAVLDTDNDAGEGKTITFNCGIIHENGAGRYITVKGSGTVRFNGASTISVVKPFNVEDTATLEIGAAANTSTGVLTLGAGTTLSMPDGIVALKNSQVVTPEEGTATLYIGGTELVDGEYDLFPNATGLLAEDWTNHIALAFENAPASARLFTPDGARISLLVGGAESARSFVWTGAAGDGRMNTPGNWLLDKAPAAPGATVYFPSASGEIKNDITGFAPKSITFGTEIGDIVISDNPISDVWAVTNLSTTANVTFTAPVAYADGKTMYVYHGGQYNNSNGTFSKTTGMVIFEGGVTGHEIMNNNGSGPHNIYAGHYVRTNSTNYTNTRTASNWRCVVFDNSSLTVENSGDISQILIGNGGAFTTATATVGASLYLSNRGEYVVTGNATRNSKNEANACYNYTATWVAATVGAVIKVGGFTVKGGGSFGLTGGTKNNALSLTNDWYIGEGGLNTTSGSASFFFTRNAGDLVRIHPWRSDFAISGGSTTAFDIYPGAGGLNGGSIAFITDDENGDPRTITMNANAKFGCRAAVSNACSLTVGGSGTLKWNSTGSDFYGPTRVTDTATFAFAPGARLGAGPITVERGAALGVSGAGSVSLGNDVDFAFGSRLAFNFTSLDEAPCMAFANEPDLSNKSIFLSVTADDGVVPRSMTGKWCIATGLADSLTRDDFIIAEVPTWVDSASPISIEDGKLYLNVKQPGFSLSIR